jgi:hypothetical protein
MSVLSGRRIYNYFDAKLPDIIRCGEEPLKIVQIKIPLAMKGQEFKFGKVCIMKSSNIDAYEDLYVVQYELGLSHPQQYREEIQAFFKLCRDNKVGYGWVQLPTNYDCVIPNHIIRSSVAPLLWKGADIIGVLILLPGEETERMMFGSDILCSPEEYLNAGPQERAELLCKGLIQM